MKKKLRSLEKICSPYSHVNRTETGHSHSTAGKNHKDFRDLGSRSGD